jgi:hypothetical protein
VRDVDTFADLVEAGLAGERWIGGAPTATTLRFLPGIYQAAFFEWITGVPRAWNELQLLWALDSGSDLVPTREYPPRLGQPIEWVLMPRAKLDELHKGLLSADPSPP